jgi:AhpD family alkylhydroperoxidase
MTGAGSGTGGSGEEGRVAEFTAFRKRMNERILAEPNQVVRRFFALDTQTYQAGALDVKTKELLGLVASLVLRCDDCISYHVAQCKEAGVTLGRAGGRRFDRHSPPASCGRFPRPARRRKHRRARCARSRLKPAGRVLPDGAKSRPDSRFSRRAAAR